MIEIHGEFTLRKKEKEELKDAEQHIHIVADITVVQLIYSIHYNKL